MAAALPYIGSKISLISNADIRYEGTLDKLDPGASTIALRSVRACGTEGRTKGVKEIPGRDEIYEYIVFRGSDIKDIVVCEPPKPEVLVELMRPRDPAIIETSEAIGSSLTSHRGPSYAAVDAGHQNKNRGGYRGNQNNNFYDNDTPSYNNNGGYSGGISQRGRGGQNRGQDGNQGNQGRGGYNNRGNYGGGQNYQQNYAGGGRQNRGGVSRGGSHPQNTINAQVSEAQKEKERKPDFDFDASNKVLQEVEQKCHAKHVVDGAIPDDSSSKLETEAPAKFYDPNNFFDSISCEALEKQNKNAGNSGRPAYNRQKEREINAMTFGMTTHPMNYTRSFENQNRTGSGGRGNYRGGQNWNSQNNNRGQYSNNNYGGGGYGNNSFGGGQRGGRSNNRGGYNQQQGQGGPRQPVPAYNNA